MSDQAIQLMHGDCLALMPLIPAGSVDCIITDLPYSMTACAWDVLIPFEPMWSEYNRVSKKDAATVLTACGLFEAALKLSNAKDFRYEWIWNKVNLFGNLMNANSRPMRQHENVLVFYRKQPTYNPQMRQGVTYKCRGTGRIKVYGIKPPNTGNETGIAFPGTILPFKAVAPGERGLHPTQKPVALLEYLIRTYTNEGDTVLDSCMGSASTGIACMRTGRKFIGIEKDETYFRVCQERVRDEQRQGRLFTV